MDADAFPASGISRRRMLGAGGVAGAAVVAAGGCSAGDEEPEPQDALKGTVVARTRDIPEGSGKILKDDKLIVTQPTNGEFTAFSAVCTHAGCTIQEVRENLHCLCHGSEFDIATGEAVKGPASKPLKRFDVSVNGGDITLEG